MRLLADASIRPGDWLCASASAAASISNCKLPPPTTDLNIALAEQHSFPLADVFQFLHSETMPPILEQAALASPIFGTRWRWDATRALALLRFQGGKKVPPQIQRMRSDDLLASVFPDVAACQENIEGDIKIPDHPLVREVMKDVLTEALDIEGLAEVLRGIEQGRIRCLAVDTPVPSQFSHEILNANPYAYLDDAPLKNAARGRLRCGACCRLPCLRKSARLIQRP